MAGASILSEALKSAWSSGGTTGQNKTPTVSPGLDPGKYGFELLFNQQRREEEAAEKQRLLEEEKRQFDVAAGIKSREQDMMGIGMLAEQRGAADKNARIRAFRKALLTA